VSPSPQMNRGRTTTVRSPGPFAARTSCSASALDRGYGPFGCDGIGRVSSASMIGPPSASTASVPTCSKVGTPAARAASMTFAVPWTVSRSKSFQSPQSATLAAA